MIRIQHGNTLEVVPRLVDEGVIVDAIVTDPPYSLGFMGKQWDRDDIAFRLETWATIGMALKPGGYLLAFGGTRTHHRIWAAIEDGGFVIQDTIMWLYGQGFPKGREQLKPAFEPICVAYKPGGPRGLQVDECRIEGGQISAAGGSRRCGGIMGKSSPLGGWEPTHSGRWPANICHDGSDEVMAAFAAFSERATGIRAAHHQCNRREDDGYGFGHPGEQGFGDTGTAARFFYCGKAGKADRAGSKHPTVKPIALLRWLVSLVTPKGGLVLDCFAGSGTTAIAALATGRNAILIEKEAEYAADIRDRLRTYEDGERHSIVAQARNYRETQGSLL